MGGLEGVGSFGHSHKQNVGNRSSSSARNTDIQKRYEGTVGEVRTLLSSKISANARYDLLGTSPNNFKFDSVSVIDIDVELHSRLYDLLSGKKENDSTRVSVSLDNGTIQLDVEIDVKKRSLFGKKMVKKRVSTTIDLRQLVQSSSPRGRVGQNKHRRIRSIKDLFSSGRKKNVSMQADVVRKLKKSFQDIAVPLDRLVKNPNANTKELSNGIKELEGKISQIESFVTKSPGTESTLPSMVSVGKKILADAKAALIVKKEQDAETKLKRVIEKLSLAINGGSAQAKEVKQFMGAVGRGLQIYKKDFPDNKKTIKEFENTVANLQTIAKEVFGIPI